MTEAFIAFEKEATETGFLVTAASVRNVIEKFNENESPKAISAIVSMIEQIMHVYQCELESRITLIL